MKLTRLFAALLIPLSAHAFWGSDPTDTSEVLAQLFGKNTAFTATANMSVKNRKGKETQAAEMEYAFLDGKLRIEIDMTKTKAGAKRPEQMGAMADMGLGKMVTLVRPDKKTTYIVYPGLKAYCEAPKTLATKSDGTAPKMDRTELGKETIDGHPCTKSKVVLTDTAGKAIEMRVWNATDLRDFPLQTEMDTDDGTVVTTFKNVKLVKPDAAQFDPPTNFTRYDSVQEMMMQSMQQMLNLGR